ncbi:MAG: CAAX prenyl protease-related protein [Verrucomicrobiota bacterium]
MNTPVTSPALRWPANLLAPHPVLTRALPFFIFVGLTGLQGQFGEESRCWFYLAKTLVGAWLIWSVRPLIAELEWRISWQAVAAGIAVYALWVGMDGWYPKPGKDEPWNPHTIFGQGAALAWFFIVVRIAGSSLVVPMLEEVFFRSLAYRYVASVDFLSIPLSRFLPVPFLLVSAFFAAEHREWLPGLLCGFIFQGLVIRTGRLGDAVTAHALTNFLLGLHVVWKGAWNFW